MLTENLLKFIKLLALIIKDPYRKDSLDCSKKKLPGYLSRQFDMFIILIISPA